MEDVHSGGMQEENVFNISIIVLSFTMGLIGKMKKEFFWGFTELKRRSEWPFGAYFL